MRKTILGIFAVTIPCAVSAGEKSVIGKVTAVDSVKNTITIGDTALDESRKLEVSRKTEITVDGKKESLPAVKVGHHAEVTYDDKLEIASAIIAIKELDPAAEKSATEKKQTALRNKITGAYSVTLLKSKERRDLFFNIWKDSTVRWNGEQIGTWEIDGEKLLLNLTKPEMSGRVKFVKNDLVGELNDPQKHFWKIACTRLYYTRWDFEGPTGRRVVTLWSNGRIDTPENKAKWASVGNKIDLIWPNGFTDACYWSADKRRFEGKNKKDELISGKLIDE